MTQDVQGNIFWEALNKLCSGRGREAKVAALKALMKAHYKKLSPANQIQNLTLQMIWADTKKTPKLRAKGAETRNLVPWGVELAEALHERYANDHTNAVLGVANNLLDFYVVMHMAKYDAERAARACRQCCILYQALGDEARRLGESGWVAKPKWHLFQELAEFMARESGNPRFFWSYKDEDFVGLESVTKRVRTGSHCQCWGCEPWFRKVFNKLRVWELPFFTTLQRCFNPWANCRMIKFGASCPMMISGASCRMMNIWGELSNDEIWGELSNDGISTITMQSQR